MSKDNQVLEELTSKEYEQGWTIDIETDSAPKGLSEDIIRFISKKKNGNLRKNIVHINFGRILQPKWTEK